MTPDPAAVLSPAGPKREHLAVYLLKVLLLAAAYFVAARLGLLFSTRENSVSPVWPPAGVATAVLVLWGVRYWPGVALGTLAATWTAGNSPGLAAVFMVGSSLEAALAAWWLHLAGFDPRLGRVRDVLGYVVLAGLAGPVLSAFVGIIGLAAFGGLVRDNYVPALGVWWVGDAMGALIVGPTLLSWAVRPRLRAVGTAAEAAILAVVVAILTLAISFTSAAFPYLLFPPVIWAAIRFGPRGASLATVLIAIFAVAETVLGRGAFATAAPTQNLIALLTFTGTLTLTALLLAALTTERLEAERERWEATETQRALFANSPLAILALDLGSRVTAWNAAAERLFGWREDETRGRPSPLLSEPGDDPGGVQRAMFRGASLSGVPVRRRHRDGRQIPVNLSSAPLRDRTGAISGVMEIYEDLSERQRAEHHREVLAGLAHQLSGAVSAEEAARLIVDAAQSLCGWDACSLDLYSASEDRMEAVVTIDTIDGRRTDTPPAYTGAPPSPMARRVLSEGAQLVLRGRDTVGPEDLKSFGDTGRRSASLIFVPIRSRNRAIGVLSLQSYAPGAYSAEDVLVVQTMADHCAAALERIRAETSLHGAQEELRQAQKMEAVGRLAGGVAHDFNNLLTTILSTVDLLLDTMPVDSPAREDLLEVRRSGQRAAALTSQLLAFSRKQVMAIRILDLNELVAGVGRLLDRLLGQHIEVATILSPGLGRIRADAGQIEQVLMNLAVNARDAMPNGGRLVIQTLNVDVTVSTGEARGLAPGSYVQLSVSDTGSGMDAEIRAHAFEPFFTTKEPGKGTGLGLATVYGIINQCGGHIAVESDPGRGTTFRIHLPRVEAGIEQEGAAATAPRGGSETILLVEDEGGVLSLARRILEAQGYRVLPAASGIEALARAREHSGTIDLLLTDVVMARMNGGQLADALTAERPDLKVLFMSGYTDTSAIRDRMRRPGSGYLQKPFTPAGLTGKVREVLDGREVGSEK